MDERDVFVSKIRKELEDKEEENRMLQARLEIMRQENERAMEELRKARKDLEEARNHYEEVQERYKDLMDSIVALMAKLKE